jgi:hypothetical protein
MRIDCEEPGFESAYIDIETSRWTRPEVDVLTRGAATEKWFEVVRRKCKALSLPVLEGEPVTVPDQLTAAALDRLDYVLFNWVVAAVTKAGREVIHLGNAPWRRLSATPETDAA